MHPLTACADGCVLPQRLNDPLDYLPHPLCKAAAAEVFRYLHAQTGWAAELEAGKMFGVLIVRDNGGRIGFLAAFSGNLDCRNDHDYFVPPVYDMLEPDGFFRRGEARISAINRRIAELESSPERIAAWEALQRVQSSADEKLAGFRMKMERAKSLRDARRRETSDPTLLEELDNESRREKSEFRRLKSELRNSVEAARAEFATRFLAVCDRLKSERRRMSEELQRQLFASFRICDRHGERRDLLKIFADAEGVLPPAGAGECAAPKLLQYAFLNALTPLAIAEFWYGRSPKGEVRRHGSFYNACRGKCKPILEYMLRGMALERRPRSREGLVPQVVFEDDALVVVVKPAGMLSVEGKIDCPSVEQWARCRYGSECEPRPVHRLDMDVSGLLLIAKGLQNYKHLQEQFLRRRVVKRYAALLEGEISAGSGRIELPLRPDPTDRPRQVVDRLHGKPTLTVFRVRERREGATLVEFEPVTGRTHQLRVHAASAEGLDAPITGDTLYGAAPADRLYLHNEFLEFEHPVSGRRMRFESPIEF